MGVLEASGRGDPVAVGTTTELMKVILVERWAVDFTAQPVQRCTG